MNYIESEAVTSNENSGVVIEGVKIDTKIKDFLMDDTLFPENIFF